MPHIMVSMLYIKSVNTLNHNTTFASKVNFIDKQRTVIELVPQVLKIFMGLERVEHQSKGTQREALVYRGHILYFSEFHPKDKIHLCFKINKEKSQHSPFAPLPYNTPCLPLNLCISFVFYSFWVEFHWS